eukprot:g70522.t1
MTCTRIENFDVRVRGGPLKISKRNSCVAQWISLVHLRLYFLPQLCLVILASVRPQLSLNINFQFSVPAPNSRHRGDNCPQPLWMKRDAFQFRYSLGVEARDLGVAEAARKWNVTYWKAWYWLGKLQGAHPDPNLQDVEIVRILKNYALYRRRNCRSARGTRVVLGRDMSEHVDVTYSVTYLTSLVHPRGAFWMP